MNERITQLAEQAGFEYSSQWTYWTAYEQDLERFAELVIQDYIEQIIPTAEREKQILAEEREDLAVLAEEVGKELAKAIRGRTE